MKNIKHSIGMLLGIMAIGAASLFVANHPFAQDSLETTSTQATTTTTDTASSQTISIPAPKCGSANNKILTAAPSGSALCEIGNNTSFNSTSTGWIWKCNNSEGSVDCKASRYVAPTTTSSSDASTTSTTNNTATSTTSTQTTISVPAPRCGSANEKTMTAAPSGSSLCEIGSYSIPYSTSTGWNWNCFNSMGSVSCRASRYVAPTTTSSSDASTTSTTNNTATSTTSTQTTISVPAPRCGSANEKTMTAAPSGSSLCEIGSYSIPYSTSTGWNWNCFNSMGSVSCRVYNYVAPLATSSSNTTSTSSTTTVSVSAPKCGSADGQNLSLAPSGNVLCQTGNYSAPYSTGTGWNWNCSNSAGSASCSAFRYESTAASFSDTLLQPVCGSVNGGTFTSAPMGSSLCLRGSYSVPYAISGGWEWKCTNSVGIVKCGAKKALLSTSTDSTLTTEAVATSVPFCGNANGGTFMYSPSGASLCSSGVPSPPYGVPGGWEWKCSNLAGIVVCGARESVITYSATTETKTDNQAISSSPSSQITSDIGYRSAIVGSEYKEGMNFGLYPENPDSDRDGLSDNKEKEIGTNPNNPDSDKDGLSDGEEFRRGTDPKQMDTDQDGVVDGDEVRNGSNPLKKSSSEGDDKVSFENPKEAGEVSKSFFVNSVELVQVSAEANAIVPSAENPNQEIVNKKLKLSGAGIPNSFVTIYIYSDPIIVTIKTDSDGNWVYELDKDLEDGQHEAYVAVTDNTGKITEKSQPIKFIKTAEAASAIEGDDAAQADQVKEKVANNEAPSEKSRTSFIIIGLTMAALFLGVALAIIGLLSHKHRETSDEKQANR